MIGRVVHAVRQYGFIYARAHGRFFFHTKDVLDDFDPQVGDLVRFEPVEPDPAKGPHARDVALAPKPQQAGDAGEE